MNNDMKFNLKFFSPVIFFISFSVVLCILCGEALGWLCLAAGLMVGGFAGIVLPAKAGKVNNMKVIKKPSMEPLIMLLILFIVIIMSGGTIASWLKGFNPAAYDLFSGGTIFIIAAMNVFFLLFSLRQYNRSMDQR